MLHTRESQISQNPEPRPKWYVETSGRVFYELPRTAHAPWVCCGCATPLQRLFCAIIDEIWIIFWKFWQKCLLKQRKNPQINVSPQAPTLHAAWTMYRILARMLYCLCNWKWNAVWNAVCLTVLLWKRNSAKMQLNERKTLKTRLGSNMDCLRDCV